METPIRKQTPPRIFLPFPRAPFHCAAGYEASPPKREEEERPPNGEREREKGPRRKPAKKSKFGHTQDGAQCQKQLHEIFGNPHGVSVRASQRFVKNHALETKG